MKKLILKVLLATTVVSTMVGVSAFAQTKTIIGGANRYATAVEVSKHGFETSKVAILVNGGATADGLAMTPLAKQENAPILLTTGNTLHNDTKEELIRLGVEEVIIGGGTGVVSEEIEAELRELEITVTRLDGKNRYETSNRIAQHMLEKEAGAVFNDVVIVNGLSSADSLSIASVAGMLDMPIFLTNGEELDEEVLDILRDKTVGEVHFIGGEGVVKPSIVEQVAGVVEVDFSDNRLGGLDRYETNALVIDKFFEHELERVYVAKGYEESLVDALAIGSPAAISNAPVILVNKDGETSEPQKDVLNLRSANELYQAGLGLPEDTLEKLGELLVVDTGTEEETPEEVR